MRTKIERDELMKKINLNSSDGREEILKAQAEVAHQMMSQKVAYEAQFIEYVSEDCQLLDWTIS